MRLHHAGNERTDGRKIEGRPEFGLLSTQFEAVDGNVMVTTSPGYGTVGHGDVKAQRKFVTRVADYSNRIAFEGAYPVGTGFACGPLSDRSPLKAEMVGVQ